jgi:sporulation protein YlmC with PRC-barrel domain
MTGVALLTVLAPAAYAQTMAVPNGGPADRAGTGAAPSNEPNGSDVRQRLLADLREAGFTDVRIMPDSFLVQAKDRSGNPVTMFINPTSVAMVTREQGDANSQITTATGNASATRTGTSAEFANIPPQEELNSKVIGLEVYNNAHQDIGKIKDVAFDANGLRAYIVAVGGFLGVGDRYVAVKPSAIEIAYNPNDKAWHAAINADATALKAAPEYKYSSNE